MRLVQAVTGKHYNQIRALYHKSFPKCERKPFRLMKYKQRQGDMDIWYIVDDDRDVFAGLAITMNSADKVLLDYFAIDENKRGMGYGSKALAALQNKYQGSRFFLEIESTFEEADNQEQRKRRKSFYLANGMQELGVFANVFGTKMELLGYHCKLTFEEYLEVYRDVFGKVLSERLGCIEKCD